MALTAALLGWLFDGLEMGLFPLVARPALLELLTREYGRAPDSSQLDTWVGIINALFLVGAATGGVLFGWLGDRFGRVKSMMLSVLTYALVSGACGFATAAWQVGALRFIASLGMGGEWSLGVALINELWPDRSRAFLAGLMGAAGNVGYLLIALIGMGLGQFVEDVRAVMIQAGLADEWANHLLNNGGWRFLMMLGAVPALLTFFIRIFVPESEKWEAERDKGSTSHWASMDLLGVLIGGIGAIGIIVVWHPELREGLAYLVQLAGIAPLEQYHADLLAMCVRGVGTFLGLYIAFKGYTYPIRKFLARSETDALPEHHRARPTYRRMIIGACLSGVALLGTWGSVQQAPYFTNKLIDANEKQAWKAERDLATTFTMTPAEESQIKRRAQLGASYVQASSAVGAILGTILAALIASRMGRRITYFFMCLGSLVIIPTFYLTSMTVDNTYFFLVFLMGGITASFYGWLPLYLPEIFRTAVRATGQGFGFNFGRILAAIGLLLMLSNTAALAGDGLRMACASLSGIYLVGMVLIWFTPETHGQPLPE